MTAKTLPEARTSVSSQGQISLALSCSDGNLRASMRTLVDKNWMICSWSNINPCSSMRRTSILAPCKSEKQNCKPTSEDSHRNLNVVGSRSMYLPESS